MWEELAITFLDRFSAKAQAMEDFGSQNAELWDEEDGFFYDVLVNAWHVAGGVFRKAVCGLSAT